jgi:hypothetical protein
MASDISAPDPHLRRSPLRSMVHFLLYLSCDGEIGNLEEATMTTRPHRPSIPLSGLFGLVLAVLILPAASWSAQDQTSYGFVRVIEGRADLMQASSNTLVELVSNYPLMVGDEIRVPYGSRVETLLPDGTYLRLDGDTELSFQQLALSADSEDQLSVLRLLRGEVQLVLPSDSTNSEAFRVDTLNASIYLQNKGTYRIRTNGTEWSEVVVREGFAEVVTEQGSSIVRSGEQTIVEGSTSPTVRVERAGERDELERWGDNLIAQVSPADSRYVDPSIAYASAPLAKSGHWVSVGGRSAWRPYVAAGWRPYHAGWWVHSPSGLTWVSTEPWGWVTYHYGGWDLAPGWGWVWYPGPVYSPASVFWYWGPTYVGWVPRPYYTHYYWPNYRSSWGFGYRHGVFGWAGGRPHPWAHWNFCRHRHFGRHRGPHVAHYDSYHHTGAQLSNMGALQEVPRGVIATDTRPLTPDLWNRPTAAMNALTASRVDVRGQRVTGELPDVTPWVARTRQLSPQVEQAVMPRLRGGSSLSSQSSSQGVSMTAIKSNARSSFDRESRAGTAQRSGGASASRTSATVSRSAQTADPSTKSGGSSTAIGSMRSRSPAETPGNADWRNRRTLGSTPSARSQPTSRRVWDGVRTYRERSRKDTTTSVRPTPRATGGGLGSSPGYGPTQTHGSWTERPTSRRYFGGFGSSPGYGSSSSQGTRSRFSTTRRSYGGSGSSPGYGGPQRPGVRSGTGRSHTGSASAGSAARRSTGSTRSGGRSSNSGGARSSAVSRGSSSPPPN